MQTTVFNSSQLHLLQMFSRMNSEQELKEVQQVLADYYFKKVEQRAAEIYRLKGMTFGRPSAKAATHCVSARSGATT